MKPKLVSQVCAVVRIPFTSLIFLSCMSMTPVFAAATGPGAVVSNAGCMQDIAGFNLNCTANDVRVSGVADITGDGIVDENDISFNPVCDATASNAGADCSVDPGVCLDLDDNPDPSLCGDKCAFPGDTTTFSATFIFDLSTQERHDVAGYFEVMPDTGGDGALSGTCDIITLPEFGSFIRPDTSTGNYVDLDTNCKGGGCPQPDDLCGDIDDTADPIFYDMLGPGSTPHMITATCVDPDGDGRLNLPNCTSWRQPGANDLCLSPLDAYPGSPSKCNCDPAFEVPILVPAATIDVSKTASPTSVNESLAGIPVQFSVAVTNQSLFATVTISSLLDDIYNDITTTSSLITSTNCAVPQELGPGATYNCSFMALVIGQGNTSHTNTVTASGIDENQNPLSDTDDATVTILDLTPGMTLTKDADQTSVYEPGGNVSFTVVITNTSSVDTLTLLAPDGLTDNIYGNLNGLGSCSVPQTIAPGNNYSCSFTQFVTGTPGTPETDIVTATARDEEGNTLVRTDPATVDILDVESMCALTKTATPDTVNEPGGDVSFTIQVQNTSAVDQITVNSLIDTIHGSLNGQGDCAVPQMIAAGGSYSCSFTASVAGLGNTSEIDTVTASGIDDDGVPVTCSNSATVNIIDVPPAATLAKVPTMAVVTYAVTVTNDSSVESVFLDTLTDNRFGDITQLDGDVLRTTCSVPQEIEVGGEYTCEFDGRVSTSPHTNTLEGTVKDDEDNTVTPNPSDSATVDFTSN